MRPDDAVRARLQDVEARLERVTVDYGDDLTLMSLVASNLAAQRTALRWVLGLDDVDPEEAMARAAEAMKRHRRRAAERRRLLGNLAQRSQDTDGGYQ